MLKRRNPAGAVPIGTPRPAKPVSVFAEDFSLLVRAPRRLRLKRGGIVVLH